MSGVNFIELLRQGENLNKHSPCNEASSSDDTPAKALLDDVLIYKLVGDKWQVIKDYKQVRLREAMRYDYLIKIGDLYMVSDEDVYNKCEGKNRVFIKDHLESYINELEAAGLSKDKIISTSIHNFLQWHLAYRILGGTFSGEGKACLKRKTQNNMRYT